MWWKLFGSHPASVGESYPEHLKQASGFAAAMFVGCIACFIHALLPFVFQHTGSSIIGRLHDRMLVNRSRRPEDLNPEVAAE